MSENPYTQIIDEHFGKQFASMEKSIKVTLKKETAYSCALLLSTYTEIIGGLVTGNLKEKSKSRDNYVEFLKYLGPKYVELHEKYDLYSNVRSKLVHEFSPRPSYLIFSDVQKDKNGIEMNDGHLYFYLDSYFRDFQKGVKKYFEDFTREPMLIINFMRVVCIDYQNITLKEKSPNKH